MDIHYYEELITVVETGSLTAAAERLGYTLSGISRSMAALEKELGFQLLYRNKKGVIPTKECEAILPYVKELLESSKHLQQKAASIKGVYEGEIHIGTAYRHFYRWLSEVTGHFHELNPGVHFRIYNGTSTEFAEKLEKREIDFALISEREGNHEWHRICDDELVALLPVNHGLAKRKSIPVEMFAKEPYVATCPGLDIDSGRFFDDCGITPDTQFSSMDIQATYAMVDAGMGISITNQINSLTNYPGVCHRKLKPTRRIEIGLAHGKNPAPAAKAFLQFILPQLPDK